MYDRADQGELELFIIQPTPFCNIDCTYCYLGGRSNSSQMSMQVLEQTVKSLAQAPFISSDFTFCWHAGEPLVAGLDFFRATVEFLKRYMPEGVNIKLNVQTNGILLNDSWCSFFSDHSISVGLSLDGPREIHDAHRRTRSGIGTFDQTLRGLKLLQQFAVPHHVISVLTPVALNNPAAYYRFFEEQGVKRLGINVEECDGVNTGASFLVSDFDSRLRMFFSGLIREWKHRGQSIFIRELSRGLDMIRATEGGAPFLTQDATPWAIVTVDHLGRYSTFSPELMGMDGDRFIFGDLLEDGFQKGMRDRRFIQAEKEVASGIEACKATCEYFSVCGGGKPSNKLAETGCLSSSVTRACQTSTQVIIDELLDHIG